MPNLNLVISTFCEKPLKKGFQSNFQRLIFYSFSFFLRKESNAITVLVKVATQVTTAITNSKVITSLPSQLFQHKLIESGVHRLKLGISNYNFKIKLVFCKDVFNTILTISEKVNTQKRAAIFWCVEQPLVRYEWLKYGNSQSRKTATDNTPIRSGLFHF